MAVSAGRRLRRYGTGGLPLNTRPPGAAPGGTVELVSLLGSYLGLAMFTLLTLGIIAYLVYSMLRPDRF